jgi:hypothetical protein
MSSNKNSIEESLKLTRRVAKEVMHWSELDIALRDDFEKRRLPDSVYPFFESFDGVLKYHPTPYHSKIFAPFENSADDLACFVYFLNNCPDSLGDALCLLNLVHFGRSSKNASFVPNDIVFSLSKYYLPGDLSTTALHFSSK